MGAVGSIQGMGLVSNIEKLSAFTVLTGVIWG